MNCVLMKGTHYIMDLFCILKEELKKSIVQWQMRTEKTSKNICSLFLRVMLTVAALSLPDKAEKEH